MTAKRLHPLWMGLKRARALIVPSLFLLLSPLPAGAGHEVTYYPAFYPSEITLTEVDPRAAAGALASNRLHVYLGAAPDFSGPAPKHLRSVKTLAGYLLLTLDPRAPGLADRAARCALAAGVQRALAGPADDAFVPHPYPVTPYHESYLAHADRLRAARPGAAARLPAQRKFPIRAQGPQAKALSDAGWTVEPPGATSPGAALIWEAADTVLAATRFAGWAGPPWIKEGWYEAWQLLAPGLDDRARAVALPLAQRLMHGDHGSRVERFNLERELVLALMAPCTRVAVGYSLRREFYNDDLSFGVENIAPDSTAGLNNPIFVRTVKLKDFPWNGHLRVGADAPRAAWNPVAGFSDAAGRFVWSVVADDAYMTAPSSASWLPNRMDLLTTEVQQFRRVGIQVPPDALLPEAGTGILRPVGAGKTSTARVTYRVLSSPFMDGKDTEPADLLYPYALAFRWGAASSKERDPAVAAATALVRERLVGVRVRGTIRTITPMAGVDVPKLIHTVEVYVNHSASDSRQVAALAPPWSAVPWQLLVLCEEAVARGVAAFSEPEARRRGVPWLDLARDASQLARLRGLVAEFERTGYRSPALATGALAALVTPEAVAARWKSLGEFAGKHGHLLDTNGAYLLKRAEPGRTAFEVVRNFSYAVGLGTYNAFADMSSAHVTALKVNGRRVTIEAELETIVRAQRDLVIAREPFRKGAMRGFRSIPVQGAVAVIASTGKVVAAPQTEQQDDGRFVAQIPANLRAGRYTVAAAIYADGNSANAQIGVSDVLIGGR